MQNTKKHAEGLQHLAAAKKHLKTGFFKWKPDYDSAISEYEKAATAFRNAKSLEEAADTYIKTSKAQKANGSNFHAAKCLESAVLVCRDMKKFERLVKLAHEAATIYLEDGVPDTAAIALERAAKMVEFEVPVKAIELYGRLCDVGEQEARPRLSAEGIGKVGRINIRLKRLPDAANAISKEINYYNQVDNNGLVNRLVMALVLIHLHLGDSVAASKVYHAALSYSDFAGSEHQTPVATLIQGYDDADQEMVNRALSDPAFRNLENDFQKLARDLRVPGSGSGRSRAAAVAAPAQAPAVTAGGEPAAEQGADAPEQSTAAAPEEEEDFDDLR